MTLHEWITSMGAELSTSNDAVYWSTKAWNAAQAESRAEVERQIVAYQMLKEDADASLMAANSLGDELRKRTAERDTAYGDALRAAAAYQKASLTVSDTAIQPWKEALRCLCDKLDAVDKASSGAFALAHIHGFPYQGPNWSKEYKIARALLNQPGAEREGESHGKV